MRNSSISLHIIICAEVNRIATMFLLREEYLPEDSKLEREGTHQFVVELTSHEACRISFFIYGKVNFLSFSFSKFSCL